MSSAAQRARMDQPGIWGDLASAPDIQQKIRAFSEMIPDGVQTILDVGCGDGAITNALGQSFDATGLDSSATALGHVTGSSVLGDARRLPFPKHSFDLALSSQMLEHMVDVDYAAAMSELRRVARQWLLISVPYREDLGMRDIKCPRCGLQQHVWGHVRTFSELSLMRDLPGFDVVEIRVFGDMQDAPWPKPLLWLIHRGFRGWYMAEGQNAKCERCGWTDFSGVRGFPPYSDRVKAALDGALHRPRRPYWLAVLARRVGAA